MAAVPSQLAMQLPSSEVLPTAVSILNHLQAQIAENPSRLSYVTSTSNQLIFGHNAVGGTPQNSKQPKDTSNDNRLEVTEESHEKAVTGSSDPYKSVTFQPFTMGGGKGGSAGKLKAASRSASGNFVNHPPLVKSASENEAKVQVHTKFEASEIPIKNKKLQQFLAMNDSKPHAALSLPNLGTSDAASPKVMRFASSRPTTAKRTRILADIRLTAQAFLESGLPVATAVSGSLKTSIPPETKNPASASDTALVGSSSLFESIDAYEPSYSPAFPAFPPRRLAPATPEMPSTSLPIKPYVHIRPASRQRPQVKHDYLLGKHNAHCSALGSGTIQSHLARSIRSRNTTFGASNRVEFLAALAKVGEFGVDDFGVLMHKKRLMGRDTLKLKPEVDKANAVGLTQCGSAATGEGRILAPCCTFGKSEEIIAADLKRGTKMVVAPLPNPTTTLKNSLLPTTTLSGRSIPKRFQDIITSEDVISTSSAKVTKNEIVSNQDAPRRVSRYAANLSLNHDSNHVIKPQFCSNENTWLRAEPWVEDHQKRKAHYAAKIKNFVKDKNSGDRVAALLR